MHALAAALALALAQEAPAPVPMYAAPPASLLGGEVMPVGNAQLLAWAGWPGLGFMYAQGFGEADAGGELRLDYATGELELGGLVRLPLVAGAGSGLAFRAGAGLYSCFGASYGRYEHRADAGIHLTPGLAWSTSAGVGTFAVGLDLRSAATFQRGGGLWFAPTLSVSVEVPIAGNLAAGARLGLFRRWDRGGAPGALRSPESGAELVALVGYRLF